MNDARQMQPPPPSQIKKRKGPDPPPPVDGNTSSKRIKTSEPGGLVSNWKENAGLQTRVANKLPAEFDDNEDDFVEGEFDRPEQPDTLKAVRASKPSTVKVEPVSVSVLFICDLASFLQTVCIDWHENHPTPHLQGFQQHTAQAH